MVADTIERVAVLGAGRMGHGIAEVAAIAGDEVVLRDVDPDKLAEGYETVEWSLGKLAESGALEESPAAVLDRIEPTTDLADAADADLVIEAIPERLALKRETFERLEDVTDEGTLLASNTSSLPITAIASATDRPERVLGLHFFNPPVRMDAVEVIAGDATTNEVVDRAQAWVESIDKRPIRVETDVRGFVVNSVLGPYIDEPAWMVSAGEATIREADAAMVHRRGYPMGPFELADLTGIDVGYRIRREWGIDVPPIMERAVEAGDFGRTSGRGYYDYETGSGPDYETGAGADFDTLRVEARMVNRAASLVGGEVATVEDVDAGVRLGLNFPEGICRRADNIGLDVVLSKLRDVHEETGADRYDPHPHLELLVERGHVGVNASRGFYEY